MIEEEVKKIVKKLERNEISWQDIKEEIRNSNEFIQLAIIENYKIYSLLPAEKAVNSMIYTTAKLSAEAYIEKNISSINENKDLFVDSVRDFIENKEINSRIDLEIPVEKK